MQQLFLQQSYQDCWETYEKSLRNGSCIRWDYVILTASNEAQAESYRTQIEYRSMSGYLPENTKYVVLADPDGKRVGSGGATLNVLRYLAEDGCGSFSGKRILVIHSGGDSKRIPQYSICGKIFSPVPRELPDGRNSTLFDEFMISMAGVAGRLKEGMLVLSGDVLLLFNPLQIDFTFSGAAALSIKEPVSLGTRHGVFLNDGSDYVVIFLHKHTEEVLTEY
ncbi:MAG: bifunctional fucokinase/L-fucose-1-P-guanylyltransferase, partial [Lachnospiraceae bacterium]|nr:bifunctional fucokinase/L-fucose-1-P-guanylyltransferase [Lachnospiraceae bacterium]